MFFQGWDSTDPRWIGAWWLGSLILAFLISVFAMVVGSFPRNLKHSKKEEDKDPSSVVAEDPITPGALTLEVVPLSRQQKIAGMILI